MARVKDIDKGYDALVVFFEDIGDAPEILVGIRGTEGVKPHGEGGDLNMATLAAIHEFGAPDANIPERSFLRSTVDENRSAYEGLLSKAIAGTIDDARGQPLFLQANLARRFGLIGLRVVADIQRKLSDPKLPPPPLSPATIARKGSDNPLIDTGRLWASIDHELRKRNKLT